MRRTRLPRLIAKWLRTQELNLVSVAYETSPPSPAAPRSPRQESNLLRRFRRPTTFRRQGDETLASLAGIEPAYQASEAQDRPSARTSAPSTGLEPVVNRLEGGVPSIGRGHGVERGSRTLFRWVAITVLSSQFPTWKPAVMGRQQTPVCLSFDRCRAVDGDRTHHIFLGKEAPSLEGRPHGADIGNRTRSARFGRPAPHLEDARVEPPTRIELVLTRLQNGGIALMLKRHGAGHG
jgi:hypothetical protein